jgi:hypothetical protein
VHIQEPEPEEINIYIGPSDEPVEEVAEAGCEVEVETFTDDAMELGVPSDYLPSAPQGAPTPPPPEVIVVVQPGSVMRISNFTKDDAGMQYYTGLENVKVFNDVLCSLGPDAYRLNYYQGIIPRLDVADQMLLALVKLRTARPNFELARMFDIPEKHVSPLFVTWIRFMGIQWRKIDIWPSKGVVGFFSPEDFYLKFPSTS